MKKGKMAALIGTGAVVGVGTIIGGTYLVTKRLVDTAMNRNLPKNMKNKCKETPTDENMMKVFKQIDIAEKALMSSDTEMV